MTLSVAAILSLSSQCAPNIAPQTVAAIVATESQGEPLALNVNDGPRPRPAATRSNAIAISRRYVAAGYSVDLGLGQINSRNMRMLGLTWANVFDPCTSIAALGRILTGNYEGALRRNHPQAALRIALSLYNTGSVSRGFRNGYVARVVGNAGVSDRLAPAPLDAPIATLDSRPPIVAENSAALTPLAGRGNPPADWNLFGHTVYLRRTALASSPVRSKSVWSE